MPAKEKCPVLRMGFRKKKESPLQTLAQMSRRYNGFSQDKAAVAGDLRSVVLVVHGVGASTKTLQIELEGAQLRVQALKLDAKKLQHVVTHSLGGLIVKGLLTDSLSIEGDNERARQRELTAALERQKKRLAANSAFAMQSW
jgi:hypothetical protein